MGSGSGLPALTGWLSWLDCIAWWVVVWSLLLIC